MAAGHGRQQKAAGAEYHQTHQRHGKPDQGTAVLLIFFPLVQEDDREHCGHDKIHALGAEGQHRAQRSPKPGAAHPVKLIQQGDEEHEPALVHPFRRRCRAGDGKGLVAHGKDHVKAAPAVALVALQHGKAVEQVPRLDHQRHQKGRQRRERAQQQACQHEFQRAAVHDSAHEHGHPHRQPQGLHIDAVAQPQHKITCQHRDRLRKSRPQRPQAGVRQSRGNGSGQMLHKKAPCFVGTAGGRPYTHIDCME